MNKKITLVMIAFVFTMFLAVQAFAQSGKSSSGSASGKSSQQMGQAEMSKGQEHYFRVSKLMDQTVKNTHGQTVGTIKDIVVTPHGAQYLVMSPEGSQKLVPVPLDRAHVKVQNGQIVAMISKEQMKNAPSFSENQWPNFASSSFEQKVHGYYASGGAQKGAAPQKGMSGSEQEKGGSMEQQK